MRNLIDITDLSVEEIDQLIATAEDIIANPAKYSQACAGKQLATLFFEPSTRTRLSFESAMLSLGGSVLGFSEAASSSSAKGETVGDTIHTVSCYADIIAMRHPKEGAPFAAAMHSDVPIINAGDGAHEHPTQGLLDMFTIKEVKGHIDGLKVVIVGDIDHGRVARSNIYGLKTMGADVHLVGPRTLLQPELEAMGVKVHYDLKEAIQDADVINVLRIQKERQGIGFFPSAGEYNSLFGINRDRLKWAKDDVLVLHPGPMNRGIEIEPDTCYSEFSSIQEQVKNGVSVRMAVLYLTIMGGDDVDTTR